jgi:hypothetical protein
MDVLSQTSDVKLPHREANEILGITFKPLLKTNFLAFDGNGFITALPQYVYAFKLLQMEEQFQRRLKNMRHQTY